MASARSILVATDFSDTSREAVRVARAYGDAMDARVHLLHVIPDPARLPWSVDAGPALSDLENDWRSHAERWLARARDEAGLSPDRTALMVAAGEASREILAAAAALRADLIVLGTHGHGFVGRLVMGSVADKVLRHADRPVLIVPPVASSHHDEADTEPAAEAVSP